MIGPPWVDPPLAWMLDDEVYRIVPPTTRDLIPLLLLEKPGAGMILLMSVTDREGLGRLYWRILDRDRPPVTLDLLEQIADAVVALLLGLERWLAAAIWAATVGDWPFVDGHLIGRGVDVMELPPPRATNTVLGVRREWLSQDPDAWRKWWDEAKEPPPRVLAQTAVGFTPQDEESGWAGAMALAQADSATAVGAVDSTISMG